MSKTITFKTNITCGHCKSKVSPFLDRAAGIAGWDIDLEDEAKLLTIQSNGITSDEVVKKLDEIGYTAELV